MWTFLNFSTSFFRVYKFVFYCLGDIGRLDFHQENLKQCKILFCIKHSFVIVKRIVILSCNCFLWFYLQSICCETREAWETEKKNNITFRTPEIRACQEQTQPRNSVKSKSISAKKLLVLIEKGSVEQTT